MGTAGALALRPDHLRNEDNPHSVRWTNVEVIRMLRDIRAALTVTPKPMNDNTNQ